MILKTIYNQNKSPHISSNLAYLVIIEIGRNGFIGPRLKNLQIADAYMCWLKKLVRRNILLEQEYLVAKFKEFKFKEYHINGNSLYLIKSFMWYCDGTTSLHILPIHIKTFNLGNFIGERSNTSFVLEKEKHEFVELYPQIYLAN